MINSHNRGYFYSIFRELNLDPEYVTKYEKMLFYLGEREFVAVLPMDDSRRKDGLCLRKELWSTPFDWPCSILEVIAALSIRLDNEWFGTPGEPNPSKIFKDIIHNLRLDLLNNQRFTTREADPLVNIWLSREFYPDGLGSPWPCRKDGRDLRKVSMWDHAISYYSKKLRV